MALVLLVGAGLLARSFGRLMGAELGFVSRDVLTFRVALPETTYKTPADAARFGQQLVDRLSELPGVEQAGAAAALPLTDHPDGTVFEFDGHPLPPGQLPPIIWHQVVTRGFFGALRVPLIKGRDFDSTEQRQGVRSAIVNQALAARFWPGQDPIGKRLRAHDGQDPQPWATVVGVVGSVRQDDLRETPKAQVYFPRSARTTRVRRARSPMPCAGLAG